MHMQNLIEIRQFILKDIEQKCILDMNQGP